ncbi:hypothetical protein V2J09_015528 [Rumex salicifolius]
MRLAAYGLAEPWEGVDSWSWKVNTSGSFTTTSAYSLIKDTPPVTYFTPKLFKKLWKACVPERIKVFVWMVMRKHILTNVERVRRHMAKDPICSLCNLEEETLLHLLRDCPAAQEKWHNEFIFLNTTPNIKKAEFVTSKASEYLEAFESVQMIGWAPPRIGWLKLNVDGAVKRPDSKGAAGGVMRDIDGKWFVDSRPILGLLRSSSPSFEVCFFG